MLPVDRLPLLQSNSNENVDKYERSYFDVLGLCCSSEIPLIEKTLSSLDGIKDLSIQVPTKTVIVVHEPQKISQLQIVKALNEARLEANIRAYGKPNYENKWPSPYIMVCGVLLLLSFLKYFYSPLVWLAIGAIAVGIFPILFKAVAALRNFMLDINVLALIAVSGSIALHDYTEAGIIVFLFRIAQWLELRASHEAIADMSSLASVVPQRAVLAETGEEINAEEVSLNTILAVKAGEVIPIDGVVVQGNCEVDEKLLTGESFPVSKQRDSTVLASSINLNGYITVKTTALAKDCVVTRMAKLVEDAQNNKSRTQRFIDKCAKYYTPVLVAISACLAVVPAVFNFGNKNEWFHLSLVALVSGCPCALLLSTPVAMFCALSKATKIGVLFKEAEHLETLAGVKVMAFDKTGTLTRGEFLVADFMFLLDDISLDTLLYWISSIESKSSHPMATAVIEFARAHEIEPKPEEVEAFQNFPGEGIFGCIDGKEIYVGNWKVASRARCTTIPILEGYKDTEGKSFGCVFIGSSLAGVFILSDDSRTGAKAALQELKLMGIKTVMLTGDNYSAANHTQAQLEGELDIVRADLLPQDKVGIIRSFQKEAGITAMMGDGVNDAPALATADIGISMGISGSALAAESADVVLMSNDIKRIPEAVQIARHVRRKIIQNVIITIIIKGAMLSVAIAGYPLVWAAVLADVGTCLLVIFNSMLLLRGNSNSATAKGHYEVFVTKSVGKEGSVSSCKSKCCKPKAAKEHHGSMIKSAKCCSSKCASNGNNLGGIEVKAEGDCNEQCCNCNASRTGKAKVDTSMDSKIVKQCKCCVKDSKSADPEIIVVA